MEANSRAEAKKLGLSTYNTRKPCKNGHLSYRYTLSGSCASCIRANNGQDVDPNKKERKEAAAAMVQAKFRLYEDDVEVFKAAAHAMALMRSPVLLVGDVWPGFLPTHVDAGTGMYKANCFVEDVEALRAMACEMITAKTGHGAAGDRVYALALWKALDKVKIDPPPPESWK